MDDDQPEPTQMQDEAELSATRQSSSRLQTPTTRQSAKVFGLGSAITEEDAEITGARLPTCNQVLRCLMWHIQEGASTHRSRWESAKLVLIKVAAFYTKANIPMISERKACERMINLLDDNAKVRAIPIKRRTTATSLERVKETEKKMTKTFQLWPASAEQEIKNPEDLAFLQSMKSDRSATFGPFDKVLSQKVQRRQTREQSEAQRREKMLKEMETSTACRSSITDYEGSSDEGNAGPSTSTPQTRSHHRTSYTGTAAFIPHDILRRPKLVSLATRMKMTPTQQAVFTEALIAEAGGDTSKVSTSYSTSDRSRRQVGGHIATRHKEDWIPPMLATLHWDSKLLASLTNQNITEERLSVIVGTSNELKLLGVPSYQPGTDRKSGDIIAQLTVNLLESWKCADSIANLTFDTTASNTGHVTAACVTIQQQLNRPLLW